MSIAVRGRLFFPLLIVAGVVIQMKLTSVSGSNICKAIRAVRSVHYYNTPYTVGCGFRGWRRCTRHRQTARYYTAHQYYYKCCSGYGGKGCKPRCSAGYGRCYNSGTCSRPNYCVCRTGYYSPHCNACRRIRNCVTHSCSNSYNQKCLRCSSGYGPSSGGRTCLAYCYAGYGRCPNRGQCRRPYHCDCPEGFFSPKCQRCTKIKNCKRHTCSSASNQRCLLCDRQSESAYALSKDKRSCVAQCSWMHHHCWPGTCSGDYSTCSCDSRFQNKNGICRLAKVPKVRVQKLALITGTKEEKIYSQTKYIKKKISGVVWSFSFSFDGKISQKMPNYIREHKLGIVYATVRHYGIKPSGDIIEPIDHNLSRAPVGCQPKGFSTTAPLSGTIVCHHSNPVHRVKLNDRDKYCVKFSATAGGYYETVGPTKKKTRHMYNNATSTSDTYCFTHDATPPFHCFDRGTCSYGAIEVEHTVTISQKVKYNIRGWEDSTSGLYRYVVTVYGPVKPYGPIEKIKSCYKKIFTGIKSKQVARDVLNVANTTGAYAVVLKVFDRAGNVKTARKDILYYSFNM